MNRLKNILCELLIITFISKDKVNNKFNEEVKKIKDECGLINKDVKEKRIFIKLGIGEVSLN